MKILEFFERLLGGRKITVTSNEEAEEAGFVVCGPSKHFPDDVETLCFLCQTKIVHRPHAPRRPPKICMQCLILMNPSAAPTITTSVENDLKQFEV